MGSKGGKCCQVFGWNLVKFFFSGLIG